MDTNLQRNKNLIMNSKEILPESEREFIRIAYCDHGASAGTTVAQIFKALEAAEEEIDRLKQEVEYQKTLHKNPF